MHQTSLQFAAPLCSYAGPVTLDISRAPTRERARPGTGLVLALCGSAALWFLPAAAVWHLVG